MVVIYNYTSDARTHEHKKIGIKFSQITGVAHFHSGAPPFNRSRILVASS
jgi:hypothetical protein